MQIVRFLCGVLLVATSESGFGLGASVLGTGSTMPLYFSGTKARATGSVWPTELGERVVELWFWIGGELVYHWVDPGGDIEPLGSLKFMFDSSRFSHGTNLEIKIKGKNNLGQFVEASASAPVKNRSVSFNLPEFMGQSGGWGAGVVGSYMASANYSTWGYSLQPWGSSEILNELQNPAVWYVNSHGNPNSHATSLPDGDGHLHYWADDLTQDNYWDDRNLQNGSGLPPFNSTGNPFVTFALFDLCHSGTLVNGWPKFLAALEPAWDGYGAYLMDQCFIGWPGFTFVDESENTTYWIFEYMTGGCTAIVTRQNFVMLNSESDHPVHLDTRQNLVNTSDECRIFGDQYTRIKKVYTGSNLMTSSGWYRPL